MNAQAKLFVPVHVILLLIAYLSSERPSEHAHSHSLARAFADALKRRDVDECSGQIVRTSSCDTVTYRIFEQFWAVKDQASMHIRTVSPEPLLMH